MTAAEHLEWPMHLSVLDGRLHAELLEHAFKEDELLHSYQRVAQQSGSPYVRYLVDLIVADEKRHHDLFADWALQLADHATFRSAEGSMPEVQEVPGDHETLLAATERLMAAEREDLRKTRQFRKETRDMRNTTVWPIVLDIMARNAKSHIRVLKFIRKHLR